jgi:hypothetical protein
LRNVTEEGGLSSIPWARRLMHAVLRISVEIVELKCLPRIDPDAEFRRSIDTFELQLADMSAYAVWRKNETADSRWFRLLSGRYENKRRGRPNIVVVSEP